MSMNPVVNGTSANRAPGVKSCVKCGKPFDTPWDSVNLSEAVGRFWEEKYHPSSEDMTLGREPARHLVEFRDKGYCRGCASKAVYISERTPTGLFKWWWTVSKWWRKNGKWWPDYGARQVSNRDEEDSCGGPF